MKREIKFRAWTGIRMEYSVVVGALGAFYAPGLDPKDSASLSPFNTIYGSATPIMQFTGLKDKNGKAIYEGDIVKSSEGISVVKYDGNGFWCCVEGRGFRTGNFFPASVDSEVIGNIYENPELIKEQ